MTLLDYYLTATLLMLLCCFRVRQETERHTHTHTHTHRQREGHRYVYICVCMYGPSRHHTGIVYLQWNILQLKWFTDTFDTTLLTLTLYFTDTYDTTLLILVIDTMRMHFRYIRH